MLCLTDSLQGYLPNTCILICLHLLIHAQIQHMLNSVFALYSSFYRVDAAVCVRARASDVCVENFSHSAWLLLQQSRGTFMLALCLRAVLISSSGTWDWTRMHALAVMHWRTLCENVDRYFMRGIESSYIVSIYRSISMNRYTPSKKLHSVLFFLSGPLYGRKYRGRASWNFNWIPLTYLINKYFICMVL